MNSITRIAVVWIGVVASVFAADPDRPNLIIIFTDDQGYEDVGCFGSKSIRTPRLDQMAAEGMRFTNFYAQPICGPSRTALMTGCYPQRVAERGNEKQIHPIVHEDEITVAEVLKTRGYATAMIGKWDLAKHTQKGFFEDLMPNHQGFDFFYGTPSSNDKVVNLYRDEELIESATDMGTLTRRYTDEALGFIEANQETPFFLYLAHSMPHTRLAVSEDFAEGNPERGLYGDVIEEIDFNVGRILDALTKKGLAEKTLVLFCSDNGPWLIKNEDFEDGHRPEDHGGSAGLLRSGKVSTWEGGVRVPAIAWAPGRIPAGTVCDRIATTMDVLPTFAAMAGADVPEDRIIDGEDIAALLAGDFEKANPDKAYYYYFLTHLQGVRQGNWKLMLSRPEWPKWLGMFGRNKHIHPNDDLAIEKPLLFNLQADPGEQSDVATEHPEVVEKLLELAERAREDIGDYNRVGDGVRFFDPLDERPTEPAAGFLTKLILK
jgi:arylsulfatase A-like enzyme